MLWARRAINMMDQRPTRDPGFVDLSSGLESEQPSSKHGGYSRVRPKADIAASIDSLRTIDHKHSMKGVRAIGMIEGRVDDPTVD